jgi:hypothetical protein
MESGGRYITRTITFGMNENPSRLLEDAFAQLDREGYRLVTVIHTAGNMGRALRWPLPATMAVFLITILAATLAHLTGFVSNSQPSLFDAIPLVVLLVLVAPLLLGGGPKLSLIVVGERITAHS